ncbi:uncharacterized protein LOC123306504 [Coccinella septempunctata]|uniref:uncharacterized protein LOC123306504 n=1 Tax=Coccinella septempunctata TaxID=41139 RepID=UPI001D05C4B1|nr:uncharacterized protein LOC123306504 [Coccinella septempunctata]
MDILNNFNFKDLSHDTILDGSESFYNKIPAENVSPISIDYPYPIESPSRKIDKEKLKEFFKYTVGEKEINYVRREYKRMKNDICNQDFKNHAVLPEFLIDYIQNEVKDEIDYGFNIQYSYGTLEKFYNNNELCLVRPNIDNNIEICKPTKPKEKIISQWLYSDPIRSIKHIGLTHSNGFTIRGKNNVYLIDIDDNLSIKTHLKLKCDIGYFDETVNHFNGYELALMDAKTNLKLFNLKEQKIISSYSMEELYFILEPRFLKMNYLTDNMLMIMTDKQIKVLDNRCKDAPQEIEIKLQDCDMLLDFTLQRDKHCISNEVYLSSKHAFFVYDIRKASVNDYIHHNLRVPPCFIRCFQGSDAKLVTLFSQSPAEAVMFGTSSPYSLPYLLPTLEEAHSQCRAGRSMPVIPDIEARFNFPITGVQIVPFDEDISIYFSNIFGEIFCYDVLLKNGQSQKTIDRIYDWLMEVYETDNPDLNMVHLASARTTVQLECDFNDVDLFNHYEKSNIHDFLADEDFNHKNWNSENFDQIWDDDNNMEEFSLLETKPDKRKVEDWIKNTNFSPSEFE